MRRLITMALVLGAAAPATAEPYRLRGSVFTSAEPPVGLMVLEGQSQETPWISAEALVWGSLGEVLVDEGFEGSSADVLVVAVKLRDPEHRAQLRAGRLVVATGAVRPAHIDGAVAEARGPWDTRLELFGGMPVAPAFGDRDYDWMAGGRVSQRPVKNAVVGLSYFQERDGGSLADSEIGVDGAWRATRWLDVAGKGAFDLVFPGISDMHLSAAARRGPWRFEIYGARRSPSRLLPATSLFAAIGDMPSTEGGTAVKWRAAPRLDLLGTAALRFIDGDAGEDLSARAVLRLDDKGRGALGVELRRQGGSDGWTGVRGTARVPIARDWSGAAEVELAVPDDSRGRGSVWPWALAAIRWTPKPLWTAAAALEADASAEHTGRVTAMLRLSRAWGAP